MSSQFNAIKQIRKRKLAPKVAQACDLQRQTIYIWRVVPVHHVATVAKLLGVSPRQVRPDIARQFEVGERTFPDVRKRSKIPTGAENDLGAGCNLKTREIPEVSTKAVRDRGSKNVE